MKKLYLDGIQQPKILELSNIQLYANTVLHQFGSDIKISFDNFSACDQIEIEEGDVFYLFESIERIVANKHGSVLFAPQLDTKLKMTFELKNADEFQVVLELKNTSTTANLKLTFHSSIASVMKFLTPMKEMFEN